MCLLRDVVARKKLVMNNYWLDNYTVEGAKKQLEKYLDDKTRGMVFHEPDAIVYMVDDFYKWNPLMQPFNDQLDVTWRVVEHTSSAAVYYAFLDIKVEIIKE